MKNTSSWFLKSCLSLVFALTVQVTAAQSDSVRLTGHVPSKAVSDATFLQHVDADASVSLTFVLPLRNKEALEKLLQRISDPTDTQHYGKYLNPEEFAEQFAPTQEDYDHVVAYAKSLGLTVTGTHSNRVLLNVSGPSGSIESSFNLHLHHYQKPNGRTFYAPDSDPEVPASIASVIHGIVGLDNHALWRTYNRQKQMKENALVSNAASNSHPSGPGGGFSPNDLLNAYNLNGVSAKGSGQIIALFELGGYLASDINAYANYFSLPAPKLTNVLVDGGSTSGIDAEVTLDIELALALAPQSQIYVYEGPNSDQGVLDVYNRIATDNIAKQVSTSWGMGENLSNAQFLQAENAIFMQMAEIGQTIYAAAGDSGAYDDYPTRSLAVDDPASQPYVVGVGGTRLTVNAASGAYANETVWNDGMGNGAGGGGVSTVWTIPSWQKNVSTTFSKTHRNVPDVALNADQDTGYSIYYNGQWTMYGGTSCAAPLWAAFTACVNQARATSQMPVLGFANPLLYAIGLGTAYTTNFHDITVGNNLYYAAKKGYDNASGWGTFNGANLLASLTSSTASQAQPSPRLDITMTHTFPFIRREMGAYKIVVPNQGNLPTSGNVTVVITLPGGLTYRSLKGSGWIFNDADTILTCTRSNVLEPGFSYPPITLLVDVDHDAPNSVAPAATVSGGGTLSTATTSNHTVIR